MIFSSNPRCYDAQHARMPTARARHDGRVTCGVELFFDCLNRCSENFLLHFLTCAVLLVQFCRQGLRFIFILCQQQSQRFLRRAQPARSVQSWPQAVANVVGQNRRTHSGDLH